MAKISKIKLPNGTSYDINDTSKAEVISLTKAQYDALATKDPNVYYAITDDNDTSMIESAINSQNTKISVLEGRFDTAVSAVTTDTEVTDIRVGADGTTYATAGDAVRGQVGEIKEDLDDVTEESLTSIKMEFNDGFYVKRDGTKVATSGFCYSEISVATNEKIFVSGMTTANCPLYVLIGADGSVVSTFPKNATSSWEQVENTILIPSNASKLIVNSSTRVVSNRIRSLAYRVRTILKIESKDFEQLNEIEPTINWVSGSYINGNDSLTPTVKSGSDFSYAKISAIKGQKLHIKGQCGMMAPLYIIVDNSNKIIESYPRTYQSTWADEEAIIKIDYDCYVYINKRYDTCNVRYITGMKIDNVYGQVFSPVNVNWTNDKYIKTDGSIQNMTRFITTDITPQKGEIYKVSGVSVGNEYLALLFDTEGSLIEKYPNTMTSDGTTYSDGRIYNNIVFSIPENCSKLVVNGLPKYQFSSVMKLSKYEKLNPLRGKLAYFFGDSIAHGHTVEISYADYLQDIYCLEIKKYAQNGGTITYKTESEPRILEQIEKSSTVIPDFVVIEGGINDAYTSVEMGSVNDNYDYSNMTSNTLCERLDKILYTSLTKFKGAKFVYVLVHNQINRDYNTEKTMHTLVKAECQKWGIPIIDVYENGMNTLIPSYSEMYTFEGTHPNEIGYKKWYVPMIAEKLISLIN